jgi:hypothetical protein
MFNLNKYMAKHLFAHNSKNLVKLGDKVKAYDNYIGEIGNANGAWFSHLHYSASMWLTVAEIKSYVNGWTVAEVKKYYREPSIDRDKMFEKKVDNGDAGYDWLQTISNGSPHPGRDYNGFGGGDSDYGYKFKSPVDGEVVFVGDWGSGWGKVIIIDDTIMSDKNYYIKSDLRNELKEIWEDFDHESKSSQVEMAERLEEYTQDLQLSTDHFEERCKKQAEGIIDDSVLIEELKTENKAIEKTNKELVLLSEGLIIKHNAELKALNNAAEGCKKLVDEKISWKYIVDLIILKLKQ